MKKYITKIDIINAGIDSNTGLPLHLTKKELPINAIDEKTKMLKEIVYQMIKFLPQQDKITFLKSFEKGYYDILLEYLREQN